MPLWVADGPGRSCGHLARGPHEAAGSLVRTPALGRHTSGWRGRQGPRHPLFLYGLFRTPRYGVTSGAGGGVPAFGLYTEYPINPPSRPKMG
jgi:hypothetical protein